MQQHTDAVETTAEQATTETTEIVTTTSNLPTIDSNRAYIPQLMVYQHQKFQEVNEGMDLDFVRMGEWIKIDKKGNFVLSSDDSVSFGDQLDIVAGQGQTRYMLWGKDGSPEKGELIVVEESRELAEAALESWLAENPDAASRYNAEDIDLRYMLFCVPVDAIKEAAEDGGFPPIFITDFPSGDSYGWGNYVKGIFTGRYKRTLGIPANTGVGRVVTRITTEDRKVKNSTDSYLGRVFTCLGMFDPKEYGLQV